MTGAGAGPEPGSDRYGELIREAHAAAVAAGEPGYLDPRTGFFVFTAAELAARGTCCESGCRHCPYPEAGTAPIP